MKFLREPLVQFLFLGGMIYLAYGILAPQTEEDTSRNIIVDNAKIQWMQSSWKKRWNRLPTKEELDGLVEQYIKETILYNEAIKMGLDKNDGLIRRRLAKQVEFLAKDLVVYSPPSQEELKKYFDEHKEKYTRDAKYTFTQIYFDPDKRGNKTLNDANKVKEQLSKEDSLLQNVNNLGDDIMLDHYYKSTTESEIRKNFGTDFTKELVKLEPGKWHGTILSGYGVHLVYIQEIIIPPAPPLLEIKERVLQDWTSDKQEELNRQFYKALKEYYTIVVEDDNISVLNKEN